LISRPFCRLAGRFLARRWAAAALVALVVVVSSTASARLSGINALAPVETVLEGGQEPAGVVVAKDGGAIFLSDREAGTVTRIATDGGAAVIVGGLKEPVGLALDGDGRLLIAEEGRGRVLRREPSGSLTVLAAGMDDPRWIAVGDDGTLYVSAEGLRRPDGDEDQDDEGEQDGGDSEAQDVDEHEEDRRGEAVLRMGRDGDLRVFADGFEGLEGVAVRGDAVYAVTERRLGERERQGTALVRIPVTGRDTAGPQEVLVQGDIRAPVGLAIDPLGAVFFTAERRRDGGDRNDTGLILKWHPDNRLTTFATGVEGGQGLAFAAAGHLLAAERSGTGLLRFRAPVALVFTLPAFTDQSPFPVTGTTVPNARVDLFVNGAPTALMAFADAAGAFSVPVPLTPNARNTLVGFATTHAGDGLTSPAAEVTITHDAGAPVVSFQAPPANAFVRQIVTVQAQASDPGGEVASLTLSAGPRPLSGALTPTPPATRITATASWDTTTFADGAHTLTATATDQVGRSTSATRAVLVDNTPPDTEITGGPSGEIAVAEATFTFTGTDTPTPTANLVFAWSLDGGPFTAFSANTTATFIDLGEGPHTFRVKARDPAGNEDLTPAMASFTVSLRAAPPTISGFSPTAGRLGDAVTITGSDFDPRPTGNQVTIGGVAASVSSATATQLVIRVPAGAGTGLLEVATARGTAQSASPFTVIRLTALAVTPGQATLPIGATQPFRSVATFSDQRASDVTGFISWASSNPDRVTISAAGLGQGLALGTATITGTLEGLRAAATVQVIAEAGEGPLPPDPATVAPLVNPTVPTSLFDATAFLYTGANPIQTGIAPGTIQPRSAAVLRGKVSTPDGWPLPGVIVTVLNHPEFGQTLTRPDGIFDLAINGGGRFSVTYTRAGYVSLQRQVHAPWQDFTQLPEVVMAPLDPQVTVITANAPAMQTARGSVVTDTSGTRQATLLFPAGTAATMTLPGGGTQPLSTLRVRATEFTVGPTGPQAMPEELPRTSAYTYAVDVTVDEALAVGATNVEFSQPVITYLENFLDWSVGAVVPVGFYDRARGVWVPSANGQVVGIVSIAGGFSEVDTDGNGTADNGLGITAEERQRLASLYTVGQTLWRVPITHVTPYDFNAGYATIEGATDPGLDVPQRPESRCQNSQTGSVITCEYQTVGENLSVSGTPFRLHYQSDRVPGRTDGDTIPIPLSKGTLPLGLNRIDLEIQAAGRVIAQSFPATPNQSTTFTWDHKDAYGRELQGDWPITVRVGYVYPTVFYGATPVFGAYATGTVLSSSAARREFTLAQQWVDQRGIWNARAQGLGGWTLDVHHAYDPIRQILHRGDGAKRTSTVLGTTLVTVAGTATPGFSGDGGPAGQAQLYQPYGVAAAPDGSLYVADTFNSRIRRIDPGGIITSIAGDGTFGHGGDGGPATAAKLTSPTGIAVGPDGSLYIADAENNRVRRVDPVGIITTVAGDGVFGYGGDGGPATQAQLRQPWGVAVAPDGSLYIADYQNVRVRKVATDGTISTVAGTGVAGFSGDGGPASQAQLSLIWGGVAVDQNGVLYIADTSNHCVRAVTTSGVISTFAGRCGNAGLAGDGGPATSALLFDPVNVTVGPDGTVYILDVNNHRVRQVTNNGIITTLAGISTGPRDQGFSGENGPPSTARLYWPSGLAVEPDGSIIFADRGNSHVRRISAPLPGFATGEIFLADERGSDLFVFDGNGRHLRTLDTLTNATRYQFGYNSAGLLTTITDADGKITTIERDGNGQATAIVAPGGQRTTLRREASGYLASITNPNNETVALTYSAGGLLAAMTDPRGNRFTYTYDAQGRLVRDDDPATGFKALTRTEHGTGWTVELSTALNGTHIYDVENLPGGDQRQRTTDPSGLVATSLFGANKTSTLLAPDGTTTTSVEGPDPRWGMAAPLLQSLMVRAPSGLTSTVTTTREVSLSNPDDPLSLGTQTDTLAINGRTYRSTYTQDTKTLTTTTPAGRISTVTLDTKGRVVQEQVTGLEPVNYTYDALGRLQTITQGSGAVTRTSTLTYNRNNELTAITDPLGRTVGFAYDLASRITSQTLSDLREIRYTYDANGNVTSITPPGRPAHVFSYTPVDLEESYTPPDLGFTPRQTQYTYNPDRHIALVTRPDGQTINLGYDAAGRLSRLTVPTGVIQYGYSPATGTLASITAPASTLSYSYDGSLLTSTTWEGAVAGSVTRSYDNNFRITSQSVNGANTVPFGYDNDSLLTTAGALSISRSPQHGLITGTTLGTATDTRTYNSFGELSVYTAKVTGSAVFDVQYTRDKLGRTTQKVETIAGVTDTFDYTYDLAGRLKEVAKNGSVIATYVYDSNGNRVSLTTPTGTVTGTYDGQDRLLEYGGRTYAYTANGELQSSTTDGQATAYEYDVLGNLRSVTLADGTQINYVVDGQNRRIGKQLNGVLTQAFLYQNQLKVVAEHDGTGAVVSRFVYGTKANVPDYMMKAGVTYRIVSDHLGSPRLVISTSDGTITQRMDYDEFGNVLQDTNPGFQPFGFAGGLYDQHTGLVRFGARDYVAVAGRWTEKDPIGFSGGNPNPYGYVLNDPVNAFDTNGLATITLGGSYRLPFSQGGFGGGMAISFPDPITGGEFDIGAFGQIGALGKGPGGFGRGTLDFGINRCSVVDLAGRGAQVSATIGTKGAFLNVDEDGNLTGVGFQYGVGLNAEGQASFTSVYSVRHGFRGFNP
jgi:RHS repeat-associated protein